MPCAYGALIIMSAKKNDAYDWICLHELKIVTRVGINAWEQRIDQTLLLDVACGVSLPNNISSLENSVDYVSVSQCIFEFLQNNSFKLIETVAQQVAQLILTQFPVKLVKIKVTKPHAIHAAKGVSISTQVYSTVTDLAKLRG